MIINKSRIINFNISITVNSTTIICSITNKSTISSSSIIYCTTITCSITNKSTISSITITYCTTNIPYIIIGKNTIYSSTSVHCTTSIFCIIIGKSTIYSNTALIYCTTKTSNETYIITNKSTIDYCYIFSSIIPNSATISTSSGASV